MIVVIRYLNDTQGDHKFVEYFDTDKDRNCILGHEHFISRFGTDFKDIPENTLMTKEEKDESDGKQCISTTDLKR